MKFFILDELPTEAIIGLGDIVRLDLYPVMKEIHNAEVTQENFTTTESDISTSEIELAGIIAEIEKEWELPSGGVRRGLGGYAAVSSWGIQADNAISDQELESHVIELRKEIEQMITEEFQDVFTTTPPAEPASVTRISTEHHF